MLRWATNNTKMVRYGGNRERKMIADIGTLYMQRLRQSQERPDPFMALAASMTVEDELPYAQSVSAPDLGVFTY